MFWVPTIEVIVSPYIFLRNSKSLVISFNAIVWSISCLDQKGLRPERTLLEASSSPGWLLASFFFAFLFLLEIRPGVAKVPEYCTIYVHLSPILSRLFFSIKGYNWALSIHSAQISLPIFISFLFFWSLLWASSWVLDPSGARSSSSSDPSHSEPDSDSFALLFQNQVPSSSVSASVSSSLSSIRGSSVFRRWVRSSFCFLKCATDVLHLWDAQAVAWKVECHV